MSARRILVVGAGAIGLVYGAHLADGGAEVALFVRPARRDEATRGHAMTRVGLTGRRTTRTFVPRSVVTTDAQAGALDPDQVWVATATDALEGAWLASLLGACPRALVVFLQPGEDALARMRALVPDESRRVRGAISMASWRAPLEGSLDPREVATPAGHAYILPPLEPTGLEGPRAAEAIEALRRGGCPAARQRVTVSLAESSAVLLPHVAALEAAGWSIAGLGRSLASLAADASREATTIACATLGIRPPFSRWLLRGWVTRVGAWLGPKVAPFDLEVYLRVHFLKVHAQTLLLLGELVRDGRQRALPSASIEALLTRIAPREAVVSSSSRASLPSSST